MLILPALAVQFQSLFPSSDHGQERARWFILTLQAILLPITASRTSNLLRTIATLFGVVLGEAKYYTFMASVKLPWARVWAVLWRAIPDPLTDGRLVLVLDDSINPKTGTKVFACQRSFDHAAKTNQSRFPWAQTIVTVGLLKVIHGRWCCLPLAFAFYLRKATLALRSVRIRGRALTFESKFTQAVRLIRSLAGVFPRAPILVVTDSWFGNNGLLKPLRRALGSRAHLLSRLRVNAVLHDLPVAVPGRAGRPRKYGARLGSVKAMQTALRATARTYSLNLYGQVREVVAAGKCQGSCRINHVMFASAFSWSRGGFADPAAGVPVAVTRGGDAGSAPEALELQSARVWPLGALSAEARTGVRWMLGVPVFTSVEKVRAGGSADTEGSVGGDGEPAPIAFTGRLRVAVDRAAAVWVDGVRVGEATPQVPFEGEGIAAGERRIGVRGAGYTAEEQVVVVSVHRPGAIHFKLRPQTPAEREAELGLDGAARAEIRAELTLVGHAAGAGGDAFAASERAALRAFQSAARLEATGYVDEATLNRLAEVAEAARRAREVAEREARVPGGAPAMVSIAAGCFRMGSPSDEPHRDSDEAPHEVCVEAFELGRTEVSFGQYDAFCAATGRDKPSDAGWGRGERPVINVSWDDAAAYAQWLSKETGLAYRLPTEAEWEYAARAGTRTPFWTGRCIRTDQANYNGTSDYNDCGAKTGLYRKQTVPAGSLPGNPWGLHEVLGNVREWTCSEYASPYAGLEQRCAERNSNPARAVRGGSWISGPRFLRAADRFGFLPEDRDIYRGFRLARTLSP